MKSLYKLSILMVMLLISMVLFAGCGSEKGEMPKQDPQIHVGTLSIADALPLYVADNEGYFKDEGLDVTIQSFKSSSNESQALSAGHVQIILNDMVVASLLHKEGLPVKAIAMAQGATPAEGRFVLVGAPGKDLTSINELAGKKIAISTNTMMEYLTDSYYAYFMGDPKQSTYVNMPNLLLRLEALLDGKDIDAAILPDPLASIAIAKGATVIVDDVTLPVNLSQSVLLADNKWITEHKDIERKFLAAYNHAINDINEHPEKYRALLMKVGRVPEAMQNTYPMPRFTANALPTEAEITRLESWMVHKGLLQEAIPYQDLVVTNSK